MPGFMPSWGAGFAKPPQFAAPFAPYGVGSAMPPAAYGAQPGTLPVGAQPAPAYATRSDPPAPALPVDAEEPTALIAPSGTVDGVSGMIPHVGTMINPFGFGTIPVPPGFGTQLNPLGWGTPRHNNGFFNPFHFGTKAFYSICGCAWPDQSGEHWQ